MDAASFFPLPRGCVRLTGRPEWVIRIPQPRVSELMTGKVDKFSADKLIGFLASVGIRFKPSTVPSARGRPLKVKCEVVVSQAP